MDQYDLAIIGGGPAGYLAAERASSGGLKTALFEESQLGGACLNEGCIPTKVMLNASKLLYYAKTGAAFGVTAQAGAAAGGGVGGINGENGTSAKNGTSTENGINAVGGINTVGGVDNANGIVNAGGIEYALSHPVVMAKKDKTVRTLVAGVRAKLKAAGTDVFIGGAEVSGQSGGGFVVSQTSGEGAGRQIECKKLLIATGSAPIIPGIERITQGVETGFVITSREALSLADIPKRLVIIGGGVIGVELADYFNSAGSNVTVVEMLDRTTYPMDADISANLMNNLKKRGVEFLLGNRLTKIILPAPKSGAPGAASAYGAATAYDSTAACGAAVVSRAAKTTVKEQPTGNTPLADMVLSADKMLLAIGRKPRITGFGLEKLGVHIEKGAIATDAGMRTNIPNLYAAGDVNGKVMLAHTAYREAECAVAHMLGGRSCMRYGAIPSVVYTNPEAAGVGETSESAAEKGLIINEIKIPLRYSGRYIAETEGGDGFCKMLIDTKKGTVAGVHMVGTYASEIILSAALMVENQLPVKTLRETAFPHPTVGEALREALSAY